jgi:peptidoglycan hydrolase-like protein with peptidoglycan-binding domain
MNQNRTFLLTCVLAGTVAVAGMAWLAGGSIVSPAEAAARTAPPDPSHIMVPVEEKVLSTEIITRGTARFGLPQPFNIAPSALKANAASVITTLPLPNTQLKEGDVALTTSGRPLFILQGAVPAYRDLTPDCVGKDVRQLKEALKRMGFDPGPIDDTFNSQTSEAVTKWYEAAGYEAFRPTSEQQIALRVLEVAHGDALKAKLAAETAAQTAKLAVKAAKAKATHAYRTAEADIAVKISDRALVAMDPRALQTAREAADANLELARAGYRAAELDGEVIYHTALDAQKVADLDAQLMSEREEKLAAELEAAKSKIGVQVPLDEIVFLPALPVRVHEVPALVGAAASGPVLSVTDNQIVIDSALPLDVAPLVKPGAEVAIDEPSLGIKTKGVVETVATNPGTNGVDGYHFYYSVRVPESPTPLQGFSLRLTMPIKSTEGAVTAVPVSAVSLAANGTSRVQVENGGKLEFVAVEPGLAADGFVEVKPLEGALKPGQLVVVGKENIDDGDAQP